jgi:hypothetical protein
LYSIPENADIFPIREEESHESGQTVDKDTDFNYDSQASKSKDDKLPSPDGSGFNATANPGSKEWHDSLA